MIQNSHLQDYLPQKHEDAKPDIKDLHVSKLLKVQSVLQKALLGHSQLDEDGQNYLYPVLLEEEVRTALKEIETLMQINE